MQFVSTLPMTAMAIREKKASLESLIEGECEVLILGTWQEWVNGDEYNEKQLVVSNLVRATNIGTRYLTITAGKRDFEIKPELVDGPFKIVIRPADPTLAILDLPVNLQEVFIAVGRTGVQGATSSLIEAKTKLKRQEVVFCLRQLEEIELVRMFKVSGRKQYYAS